MSGEVHGQGDATQQLRAWVDYFRDLGVHDFYRCGDPVAGQSVAATDAVEEFPAEPVVVLPHRRPDSTVRQEPISNVPAVAALQQSVPVPAPPTDRSFLEAPQMPLVSFNNLAPLPSVAWSKPERPAALLAIQQEIGDCTRCPLAYAGRRKIVFGDGSPAARLMFVGEGPGADEDAQGIPFVGKAGQLLNNMIAAMGLAREQVYIANIVKCRPPANRVPEPVEANTCSQFLLRQIDVVQPEAIVALGATAATYLLGVKQSLSSLRGRWYTCRGAKLAVTYHPAFLLRDPRQKGEAWKDLQMVMGELGLKAPNKKS